MSGNCAQERLPAEKLTTFCFWSMSSRAERENVQGPFELAHACVKPGALNRNISFEEGARLDLQTTFERRERPRG